MGTLHLSACVCCWIYHFVCITDTHRVQGVTPSFWLCHHLRNAWWQIRLKGSTQLSKLVYYIHRDAFNHVLFLKLQTNEFSLYLSSGMILCIDPLSPDTQDLINIFFIHRTRNGVYSWHCPTLEYWSLWQCDCTLFTWSSLDFQERLCLYFLSRTPTYAAALAWLYITIQCLGCYISAGQRSNACVLCRCLKWMLLCILIYSA